MATTRLASRSLSRQLLVGRTAASAVVGNRGFAAAVAEGSNENLTKTALNDLHKELGGDMVPFAGYELPVLYKGENGGVMKEHLWCREQGKASLFDVSHMGQVKRRIYYCYYKVLTSVIFIHESTTYYSHLLTALYSFVIQSLPIITILL